MSERGADWGQVRLILSAHRIAARRLRASDGARVLRTARDVLFAAVVPLMGVGAGQGLRGLAAEDPTLAAAGLHLVYFLLFAALAFGPLLGAGRAGLPDPVRLSGLPVAPRTAFAATVAALLTSVGTLGVLLAAACVLLGFGGGGGLVAWRLALLAPLALCGVALGQLLLLGFARVLSARRWRGAGGLLPVAVILLALLGLRSVVDTSLEGVVRDFAEWRDWTVVLPSWWAAAAATASGPVDLAPALGLPALAWWLLAAGGLLEAGAADVSAPGSRLLPAVGGDGPLSRRLPGPLAATLAKDLRLLAREPALRAVLAPQAALALLPAALVLWAAAAAAGGEARAVEELRRVYPLLPALGYTLVFLEATVLLNLLGLEGRGLAHWLSSPEPRRTLLTGKNLSVLLTLGPVNALLVGGAVVAAGLAVRGAGGGAAVLGDAALAALESLCVLASALAVGDLVSVLRPVPLSGRGRGVDATRSAGRSGGGGLLLGVLGAVAFAAASTPVALLFHPSALTRTGSGVWLALTVPLAVLGSAGLALLGARAGGALLASREEAVCDRML